MVERLLPADDSGPQYRVRSPDGTVRTVHERDIAFVWPALPAIRAAYDADGREIPPATVGNHLATGCGLSRPRATTASS
jgi:hypothetical protein